MITIAKDKKAAIILAAFFSIVLLGGRSAHSQSLSTLDQELSRVIDRISEAVVTVEARQPESKAPIFPGNRAERSETVTTMVGSGLLIDSIGHILTVLNLVDGYGSYQVKIEGRTMDARLIGIDRRHNLAVLKIDGIYRRYLEMSPFPPFVGRMALAYGRVIGHTGYPTIGIIAGRRNDENYLMSGSVLPGLMGGGVFDLSGRLIGIISSGSIDVDEYHDNLWGGIVLLPASIAYAAADKIICCGNREAGYLGIKTTSIELISAQGKVMGEAVVISALEPNSPATEAGLQIGDVITRFARRQVTTDRELQRLVSLAGADRVVGLEFLRGRQTLTTQARLTSFPSGGQYVRSQENRSRRTQGAMDSYRLQVRIDSIRTELNRLQKELNRLMDRVEIP